MKVDVVSIVLIHLQVPFGDLQVDKYIVNLKLGG
jgi:hypothetical protein